MPKLWEKISPWFLITGILFIAVGIEVIITGELKNMIVLGQAKYFVGSISIIGGIYFVVNSYKKEM